jgi:hypothetical protein
MDEGRVPTSSSDDLQLSPAPTNVPVVETVYDSDDDDDPPSDSPDPDPPPSINPEDVEELFPASAREPILSDSAPGFGRCSNSDGTSSPPGSIPDQGRVPDSDEGRAPSSNEGRASCGIPKYTFADDVHYDDIYDLRNNQEINTVMIAAMENTGRCGDVYSDPPLHDTDVFRALIDTGAFFTCTGNRSLLHRYQAIRPTDLWLHRIKLKGAVGDASATPEGFGYLRVPAINDVGYIDILCIYSPLLNTTVIDERQILQAASHHRSEYTSVSVKKFFVPQTCVIEAHHRRCTPLNFEIPGVLIHDKCYTHELILPGSDTPYEASAKEIAQGIEDLKESDDDFRMAVTKATLLNVCTYHELQDSQLESELEKLSPELRKAVDELQIPFAQLMRPNVPVLAIRKRTEKLLWHQRLGHVSDNYLYNAHKSIDGVPRFSREDPVLDKCPTCIQSKQTKESSKAGTTRKATQRFEGLSIDVSFSGQRSKNNERAKEFVGFNGEKCWILVTDHFTAEHHGSTRRSKATPLQWLEDLLRQNSPRNCNTKYVYLDQGGELFQNPACKALFLKYGYEIRPTGADASHQNGPVERAHQTVANGIRALLSGANLDVRFWPFAFHHYLRIQNALASRGQSESPYMMAHGRKEDFSHFRTFGCRVWVRPPGKRPAKFVNNSRKGIFLGYLRHTTKNILWYDPETDRVKIARHARFDEGMNDLPVADIPPNVAHLQRTQFGDAFPAEKDEVTVNDHGDVATLSDFGVENTPFLETITRTVPRQQSSHPQFGLEFGLDEQSGRVYVTGMQARSSADRFFKSKTAKAQVKGAFLVSINGRPVFTRDDAMQRLRDITRAGDKSVTLEFATDKRQALSDLRKDQEELDLVFAAADTTIDEDHVHNLTIEDIRSISQVRFDDEDLDFSLSNLTTEEVQIMLNAIRSDATTPAEQELGRFTRGKLKNLETSSKKKRACIFD